MFLFTFEGSINHSYASVLPWKKRLFARINSKYNKFSFDIWCVTCIDLPLCLVSPLSGNNIAFAA